MNKKYKEVFLSTGIIVIQRGIRLTVSMSDKFFNGLDTTMLYTRSLVTYKPIDDYYR